MSASLQIDKLNQPVSAATPVAGREVPAWVGRDLSSPRERKLPRAGLPLLVLALLAALAVSALRIDLIRTRYALSAALDQEAELLEQQRALIVRRRQLRDPVELATRARERGFRPPAIVFSLPDPARTRPATTESARIRPAVASPPPVDRTGGSWQ